MSYDEFREFVRAEARKPGARDMVSIVAVRRATGLAAPLFEAHVRRLHADGLVHLLSHVEARSLPEADRLDCIPHEDGWLIYWIRWL